MIDYKKYIQVLEILKKINWKETPDEIAISICELFDQSIPLSWRISNDWFYTFTQNQYKETPCTLWTSNNLKNTETIDDIINPK